MRMVFFASSRFGAIVFEKIVSSLEIVLIVTNPDKVRGRKKIVSSPLIKTLAQEKGIEVFQPAKLKEKETIEKLSKTGADIFLLAGFGRIVPEELITLPQKGFLNIHPSLLPKYRGPSPIQTAILAGEKETGVSLHFLTKEIDRGDILAQKKIVLSGKETYLELEKKLADLGGELFLSILPDFLKGKIKAKKQNEREASYTKKFGFEDGEVFPQKETAKEIERKVRALNPEPGVFLRVRKKSQEKILKILEAEVFEKEFPEKGKFYEIEKNLILSCQRNSLFIKKLQLEGKKPLKAKEFLLGNKWILN